MAKRKKKPGRKGDRLKIEDKDWRDAMGKALRKKRPRKGWPKSDSSENED